MVARHAGTGSPRLGKGTQAACKPRSRLMRRAAPLLATLAIGALALAARADAYIYFGNYGTGSVGRFNQNDPSDGRFDFIPNGSGVGVDSGVAVDSTYIYWTDLPTGRIGRATLDGTNVNPNFITAAGLPTAVAVNDRFIYWTDQIVPQAIGRARIDGDPSSVNQSFIPVPSTNIEGIAVDDKHIYWTQEGTPTTPAAIGRANLGGKAVDPNFITGSGRDGPYRGVAVDSKYVYWSNGSDVSGPGAISRANLDGSGVELGFITPAPDPIGVAVDATHIYWSNSPEDPDGTLRPALGRANLDGTQADPLWFEYGLEASSAAPRSWPSTRCPRPAPAATRRSPAQGRRTGCAGRRTTT